MIFFDDLGKKIAPIIGSLEINLRAKAQRTAITLEEYIAVLRNSGVADSEIRKGLQDDLNSGGRIFGEFFNALGVDITGRMGEVKRQASNLRFGFKQNEEIVWIAVSLMKEDGKACPDCTPRHKEVDTYQNWILRGLPKTGWSVCRTNCKCVLMKVGDVEGEETLNNPVLVGKE